jgi:Ca2+-binding EF-hand superfamily protein
MYYRELAYHTRVERLK